MFYIAQFFGNIARFFRVLTGPLRNFAFTFRMFMMNNPLTMAGRGLKQARYQMQYFTSLPRSFGQRLIPARFRTAKRKPGSTDADESAFVATKQRTRQRGRRLRGTARRAEFTQVHLVDQTTGERLVVHIGSTIGSSTNDLVLNPEAKTPVWLSFLQDGPDTHVRVAGKPTDTDVRVNGQPINTGSAFLPDGATLTVDDRVYTAHRVATDYLPAVTRVDAAWASNVGPHRDTNQDAIGIYQHPKAYLFTIADGVGGAYAGDEVSEFATKYMLSVFKKNIPYDLSWVEVLRTGYEYVNAEVRNFVARAPQPAGTTLTSVFIRNWTATIAHVGDSRAYLLRGNSLRQLTTDHNADVEVETRNRQGYPVTQTRSILQKAVGRRDTIEPDVFTVGIQPGDMLLLVTDGITKRVSDPEIQETLMSQRLDNVPDVLVELANSRDNTDNASATVIEVMQEAYSRDVWAAEASDRVYIGGPSWYLRLSRPQDTNTVYSLMTQTGCFLLVLLIFAAGLFWSGRQVQRFFAGELTPRNAAITTGDSSPEPSLTPELTLTPSIAASATLPADVTATATATLTPTIAPTLTPRPTSTPGPTDTPPPTATLIPPTSTLRP